MAEDIKVYFVIREECKNENYCCEDMKLAFVTCEQHRGGGLIPEWIKETEISNFDKLTKKDVFVLNEFAGPIFNQLKATKCLLVGPRCISCCLTEGTPIPSGPEPVFTIAMRGLVVTASGFTKPKKDHIKCRVLRMGGVYSTVLTDETTHLVSDTVLSIKYTKSVERGIPVMSETWLEEVWNQSLILNVNGASDAFIEHRLPPFANLQVTTSGISKKEKLFIMKLVNEYGGVFSGAFQSETTDVVVLNKEGVGGDKYKAALEYGKACVSPSWVKESAERGVALPFDKYKVVGASTSSPLAEHRLPDMSLNFSRITNIRPPSNFVDETRSSDMSVVSAKIKLTQERSKSSERVDRDVEIAFENFDMSTVKSVGPIFDGLGIWITGPTGAWRDKAAAIVSRCGGVRYDSRHPRVTHAVGGAGGVRPMWLLDCVRERRVLDTAEYLIDPVPSSPKRDTSKPRSEPESPMSKRNLQLLRTEKLNLPPPMPPPVQEDCLMNDELVNHYLSQNLPEPIKDKTPDPNVTSKAATTRHDTDVTEDSQDSEVTELIFKDVIFEVHGIEEAALTEMSEEMRGAGGRLAGAGGTHAVVPLDCDENDLPGAGAETVTVFWVKDCLSQQELLPIQYYHKPVKIPPFVNGPPLEGVVASLSTYSGFERAFLDELAKLLGATTQLRFCRRSTSTSLASTHLICPQPLGDKYLGAVKWGLPAVSGGWLLACAGEGRRVAEKDFLVGDAVAPLSKILESKPNQEETDVNVADPNKENTKSETVRRGSVNSGESTPKFKLGGDESEMSPASRYIAMARQGLLGGDTQETPKRTTTNNEGQEGEFRTPSLEDALSTPNLRCLSPTTRRRLQAVKRGELPSDPIKTPVDPFDKNIETPDSAFGAALRPGSAKLSPDARKRLWKMVQDLPSKEPEAVKPKQTPLSEIRNRFLAQFNNDSPLQTSEHSVAPRKLHLQDAVDTPPPKIAKLSTEQSPSTKPSLHEATKTESPAHSVSNAVDAQLQRLSAVLSGRVSSPANRNRRVRDSLKPVLPGPESEPGPESQPNTVGWDDTTPQDVSPPQTIVKRFMLSSNVDNREELISMIQELGGEVSESTELDPTATHLLCTAPGRSEKMLGSIAFGKWILHPAYVSRSRANGAFIDEEQWEWGNPKATNLPTLSPSEHTLALAAYRWHQSRRGSSPYGAVRAWLVVPEQRRCLLERLVRAGGGVAVSRTPTDEDNINVCFADIKRCPLSEKDANWLKSRKIPVCPPVILSAYLTEENTPDPREHCLPEFRP